MSSPQQYKILIDVELQVKAQEVIREMKKEIDQMDSKLSKFQSSGLGAAAGVTGKGNQFLAKRGILGAGAEGAADESIESEINSSIIEAIETETNQGGRLDIMRMLNQAGFDPKSVDNWMSMIKNPAGFFSVMFTRVIPILGAIYTAKEIAEFIFQELTARNRPFDLTFRRTINEEFIKMRARELRQQIRVGERQAIFVSEAGATHPINVVNTLELVRNREIFDLDAFRVRKGYQF